MQNYGQEALAANERESENLSTAKPRIKTFSKAYWREAARLFKNVRILAFAALICALRVAVKMFSVPVAPGLYLSFDCYVNAVGALVYGPLVALGVGAVSDTIGALLFPKGPYFFPFIVVEMASGFIFALFIWRKKLTATRLLTAKFTVNFVCNIILTSLIQKWYYALFEAEKVYYIINGARIVKNLVLFPLEATLICLLVNALLPGLKALRYADKDQQGIPLTKKEIVCCVLLAVFSVALILFYIFFLKDFVAAHNFKLF
ncbi:MAG: folate family ECF transporter S component [Candidatus Borkfalkiaceae bacterium]|nr:folate family ECF transporter S component [Clostridia bacterium]MDY6222922.1 folate family ECF transporter S component [Christensenellaceae bacterium]